VRSSLLSRKRRYTWARNIVFALEHFAKWASSLAAKKDWPKAKAQVDFFLDELITPAKLRAQQAKKRSSSGREEIDGLRLVW
jgi:hypothetical protein